MTLNIQQYLNNLIQKEAKISHFQVKTYVGKTSKLRHTILSAIQAKYGDKYLQDADYILFFEKNEIWTKSDIKALFELTNRALGTTANMLSKNDFDTFEFPQNPKEQTPEDPELQQPDEQVTPTNSDLNSSSNILFLKITIS